MVLETVVAVVAAVIGVVLGFILDVIRERIKSAKLKISKLLFESFGQSARVSVCVRYVGGSLPAKNVIAFLTIKASIELAKIAVEKVDGGCTLRDLGCQLCGGKTYLAVPKVGVKSEPLTWSVPIPFGRGLEGLELVHLTHVPVNGEAKLRLFDIYRVKVYERTNVGNRKLKDEFWLLKIHSEYGVTYYPRICLKLSTTNSTELILHIKLAGENVRQNITGEVRIRLKGAEYVVEHEREEYSLAKYFESNNIRSLELPNFPFIS